MAAVSMSKQRQESRGVRGRILEAAFAAFTKSSYTAASTFEIATSARVSKRELYALVGNKQEMLIAWISERARRLRVPADLPVPQDYEARAQVLASFGIKLLQLLRSSAWRSPRPSTRPRWRGRSMLLGARRGVPPCAKSWPGPKRQDSSMADLPNLPSSSGASSGGNLMVSLLLGIAERPSPREIARRARDAVADFLQLHPAPNDAARPP